MYYRYVSKSTATAANFTDILNDIALLICGGSITSLSNTCDKTQTVQLANTIPSGWTLVESYPTTATVNNIANTPVNIPVISAPDVDNRTTKYVTFEIGTNTVNFAAYETWSTATHTGTNKATTNTISTPVGMIIVYIIAQPTVLSLLIPSNGGLALVGEISRDTLYLATGTYPVVCAFPQSTSAVYNGASVNIPRVKSQSGLGDVSANPLGWVNPPSGGGLLENALRDANEQQYYPLHPLFVSYLKKAVGNGPNNAASSSSTDNAVVLGRLLDLYATTPGIGSSGDEFTADGVNYVLLASTATGTSSPRYAVKKG